MAAGLLAAALVAASGWYIADTQSKSREAARDDLERRAALTAKLITGAFLAIVSADALRERYGGRPEHVRRVVAEDADPAAERRIVLSPGGQVLAASPPSLAGDRDLVAGSAHLRAALAGRTALSDAFHEPRRGWEIEIAVPLETRFGRRVVANSGPVSIVDGFAAGFFATASALPATHGYLLDGNGRVLSSAGQQAGDGASIDPRLAAALHASASAPPRSWRTSGSTTP